MGYGLGPVHQTPICFHSNSRIHPNRKRNQQRPQTGVCQQLGSSAFLKVQPHHFDLFLDSTFYSIRRTVMPRRSFQNKPDQEEAPSISTQTPPSPVLRRNASGLSLGRTVRESTTTLISNRLGRGENCLPVYPVSTSTNTRHCAPSSATTPCTKQTTNAINGSVDSARSSASRLCGFSIPLLLTQ